MLLGLRAQVRRPLVPFAFLISASPSALVEEYESLC